MAKGTSKVIGWLYWLVIVSIVLINVIPLAGEYLFTMYGWKSYFLDFHLADEQGLMEDAVGLGSPALVRQHPAELPVGEVRKADDRD